MKLTFPDYIFSEKEIRDLKRREQVAGMLRVKESWKNIKVATGAHLQTIAIISKRLKKVKPAGVGAAKHDAPPKAKPVFVFGKTEI